MGTDSGMPAAVSGPGPGRGVLARGAAERNFFLLAADGVFFMFGSAFFDASAVLPLFVSSLTGSSLLIGLSATIRQVGWTFPQLLVARQVAGLARKKRVVLAAAVVQRFAVFGMAGAALLARLRPATSLGLFFIALSLFSLGDGVTSVPWTDIAGKCVAHTRRGRLFGSMQVIGGALAFAGGFGVRAVLAHPALGFPLNYAILFAIGGLLLLFSLAAFALVDEPPWTPPARPRESLTDYVRSVPGLLRRKPAAGRLTAVRVLVTGMNVAVPFLAVYGREMLGLPPGYAGVFVSAQMAGLVVGGLIWARVADFRGNRLLIRMAAAVSGLVPTLPLLLGLLPAGRMARLAYPLVFVVAGGAFSSTWMAFTNYLLELTDQAERPYYLGAVNTILAPFGFFGVLGGVVVSLAGYRACFMLAAVLAWLGFVLSAALPEPRRSAKDGPPA